MNEYYEKLAELAKTMPEPHRKVFENLMSLIEGKDTQLEIAYRLLSHQDTNTNNMEHLENIIKWKDRYLETLN